MDEVTLFEKIAWARKMTRHHWILDICDALDGFLISGGGGESRPTMEMATEKSKREVGVERERGLPPDSSQGLALHPAGVASGPPGAKKSRAEIQKAYRSRLKVKP